MTKQRDPYFDNLKGVLICLVCLGHCVNLYKDTNVLCNYLFHLIYAFHMPLFFYISGYFSKNTEKAYKGAFETLIIPAIPFELAYYALHVVTKADNTEPFLTPIFAYWFCFALFFSRALLPYLVRLRGIVVITFAVALAAGFNPYIDEIMSLSRFLCMLPFFLLGYYTSSERMNKIRNMSAIWAAVSAAAFAAGIVALLYYTDYNLGFTLRSPYESPIGALFRGFQFIAAVPLSLLLMKLIPKKETYLSVIGKRTLQIYFLHFYFITAIDMVNPAGDGTALNFVLMLIAAPVITLILSSGPVTVCYDLLIGAVNKLLLKEGEH